MKTDHRSLAALCITLFAGAALFVGCSSSPTSVDSDLPAPSAQVTQVAQCPTVEQAAADIMAALDANCPRTAEYRNRGQENSCAKSTIGAMLDQYDGCFSGKQQRELRNRVDAMRAAEPVDSDGDGNDGGDIGGKPSNEPTPTME